MRIHTILDVQGHCATSEENNIIVHGKVAHPLWFAAVLSGGVQIYLRQEILELLPRSCQAFGQHKKRPQEKNRIYMEWEEQMSLLTSMKALPSQSQASSSA